MTTTTTITNAQIEQLSSEAASAGDVAMVTICRKALSGNAKARRTCERAIANAAANS
jgi:hypothetical protein